MSPEHLHLVLNHLPVVGLLAALVPLAYGLLRRQREVLVAGCLAVVLFAGATPLVMATGEEAEERLEHDAAAADPAGERWMEVHEDRAEVAAVALYLTAALGLLALGALWKRPTWQVPAAGSVLVLALVALGLAGWAANAGGKIRHPELRPPVQTPGGAADRPAGERHDDDWD